LARSPEAPKTGESGNGGARRKKRGRGREEGGGRKKGQLERRGPGSRWLRELTDDDGLVLKHGVGVVLDLSGHGEKDG